MRGNAHVRFGGRAGETHITHVAQGAPVRPYYVKAGLEKQKAALLVVIGAMSDGRKEVLAIVPGYRESKASWTGVLRDLRDRGLSAAKLLVADGPPGYLGGTGRGLAGDGRTAMLESPPPERVG